MQLLLLVHSLLRWVLLILLLTVIAQSLHGWLTKRAFTNADDKTSLFLMISAHTQLIVGIIVYLFSDVVQNGVGPEHRYFKMEHSISMIVAIALITIARSRSRRAADDPIKFRRLFVFCILALVIILAAIPWPFSTVPRPWF